MTYIISDVHGEYALFRALLQRIGFTAADTLIVCGDILEKGPHSVTLARFIFAHPNIHVIRGNHEEAFLSYYGYLLREKDPDFDLVLRQLQTYIGGEDATELDWETVDLIEALPYFYETSDFICVHAGVPLLADGRIPSLARVPVEELLHSRRFKEPSVLPVGEKCVFYGHTSTAAICGEPRILVYTRNGEKPRSIRDCVKVHLDTGTCLSGVLGCFCVETCEVIAVHRNKL